MRKIWTMLALFSGLGACGGGGGGDGSGIDPRLARLDVYETQKLRVLGDPGAGVMGMPETEALNVPVTGSLIYDGSATLRVEVATTPLVLFGDASITVDFVAANTTGTLDNFFGTNASGTVVNYDGIVDVTGASAGQNFTLDYTGALASAADVLVLAGILQGTFLGIDARALAAADLEASVMQNGVARNATIIVIGEGSPLP